MSELPKPGIYFGMPEDQYHAAPALSNSGIKSLLVSSMDFWARSWMAPLPVKKESDFMELGKAYDCRIIDGKDAFYQRYAAALDPDGYPDALRTMDEIKAALPEGVKAGKGKQETIQRLLFANPDAQIWDHLVLSHALENRGKTLLTGETIARIEIAAAMIEKNPVLCKAFTGGYPQVSIFWTDPETGVPMKSRLDYLKVRAIVDLKTFGNQREKPIDRAVTYSMAERRYHIQVAVYQEAVTFAKKLPAFGDVDADWLFQFQRADPPEFLFVFQQTGPAPLARGYVFPRGLVFDCGKIVVQQAKERFRDCMEKYGADTPWIDDAPIRTFDDSEFPVFMTAE